MMFFKDKKNLLIPWIVVMAINIVLDTGTMTYHTTLIVSFQIWLQISLCSSFCLCFSPPPFFGWFSSYTPQELHILVAMSMCIVTSQGSKIWSYQQIILICDYFEMKYQIIILLPWLLWNDILSNQRWVQLLSGNNHVWLLKWTVPFNFNSAVYYKIWFKVQMNCQFLICGCHHFTRQRPNLPNSWSYCT